jgi:hypothetical protein
LPPDIQKQLLQTMTRDEFKTYLPKAQKRTRTVLMYRR